MIGLKELSFLLRYKPGGPVHFLKGVDADGNTVSEQSALWKLSSVYAIIAKFKMMSTMYIMFILKDILSENIAIIECSSITHSSH